AVLQLQPFLCDLLDRFHPLLLPGRLTTKKALRSAGTSPTLRRARLRRPACLVINCWLSYSRDMRRRNSPSSYPDRNTRPFCTTTLKRPLKRTCQSSFSNDAESTSESRT